MTVSSMFVKSFQVSTLATAVALAGCGGGSGGGNDTLQPALPSGSQTVTNPSTSTDATIAARLASVTNLQLVSDSSQFYMNNGETITLTVYALNANNLGVAGVPVSVTIPNPQLTGIFSGTPKDLTTDETGKATITLNVTSLTEAQKAELRKGISISAQVGSKTATKTLTGSDAKPSTTPGNSVVTSDLVVVSNSATLPMVVGSKVAITAVALDSNNNIIANKPVTFKLADSSANTGVFPNGSLAVTTNDRGEAMLELELKSLNTAQKAYLSTTGLTVTATADGKEFNSKVTIKGVDSTNTTTQKFDVKAVNLTTPTPVFDIKVGSKVTVTASVLGANNTGLGGVPVVFELEDPAITGVYATSKTSNVVTNENGEATIELEVKSEAFKQKLLSGITVKATAQNTVGDTPTNISNAVSLKGKVVDTATVSDNVALVKNASITSPTPEFDLAIGTKITVNASVADANGGSLANVPVTFSIPSLDTTGIASNSASTVSTNAQGQATIELEVKSLTQAQRDNLKNGLIVNAKIPNNSTVTITPLKLTPKTTAQESNVSSISVTADSNNILMAKGTKVKITGIALDKNFGGLAGKTLNFSLPDPSVTGVYNISGSSLTTNAQGEATIDLEVKSDLTQAQKDLLSRGLVVTVKDTSGKTGTVSLIGKEVNQSLVNSVTLTSNVTSIPLTVGSQFTVTATVADVQNGGINNAPVTFTLPSLADTGIVSLSPSTVTTNAQGQAVITLQVQSLTDAQKQRLLAGFTINATSNGKTATALTIKGVQTSVSDVSKVNILTNKNTLTATSGETIEVTAQARDINNSPITNVPVNFELLDALAATGVTASSALTNVITDSNGEAKITLKVGALTPDQKYYLQTSGLSFKATAGAVTSSTVTLKTQEAITANSVKTLLLTSDSTVQLALGSKVKVTALAMDANGAIIPNAQVSFKVPADSGLVNNTGSVVSTNASGEATVELEIKSLTDAQKVALQNGVAITAQSGITVGTTTVRGATSKADTDAYKFFMTQSKTVMNTASDKVSVSVRVTDLNGGIKANVPVYLQILDEGSNYGLSFSTPSNLVTDANGIATFDVVQSDIGLAARLNHNVKFKAIVNDGVFKAVEQTIEIPVTGTRIENVNLNRTQLLATDTFSITKGTLVDGNGKPIANTSVELMNSGSTDSLGIVTTTDAQGNFAFNDIAISRFNTNPDGTVNISAKVGSGNLVQLIDSVATLNIIAASNTSISYQGSSQNLRINQITPITINAPTVANGSVISVSTTRGTISTTPTVTTESRVQATVQNGQAVVYLNSVSPGQTKIAVQTTNANGEVSTLVEDTANFVSISPAKLALQVEKTIVPTNGATRVIAKVLDSNDAPVKNAIVSFSLVNDPSSGTLNSSTVITDASGQAVVTYNAGSVPSPVNQVVIQAKVNSLNIYDPQGMATETSLATPLVETQALTVQTFSSSIGVSFADKLIDDPRHVYYYRNGSIYVTNSIGQPAVNLPVSISVIPTSYSKGFYQIVDQSNDSRTAYVDNVWHVFRNLDGSPMFKLQPSVTPLKTDPSRIIYDSHLGAHSCLNEDINRNNFLDTGEDVNANGQLDPINPVAVLDANGNKLEPNQTLITDSTGKLDFQIRYPKEYAEWFTANVQVSTKVDGTESVQSRTLNFPTMAEDVSIPEGLRPNWYSPFGTYSCLSSK